MNQSHAMGVRQGGCRLRKQMGRSRNREWALRHDQTIERLAGNVFHGDVMDVLVDAGFQRPCELRMIDLFGQFHFALETSQQAFFVPHRIGAEGFSGAT